MKCVVPLAGPDLWTDQYGLRPLYPFDGDALLVKTLKSRAWAGQLRGDDYVFVVRDIPEAAPLYDRLRAEWPGCVIVSISHLTGGGMMSALAGVSVLVRDEPVIVDLADIYFEDMPDTFTFSDKVGAIVPVFDSDEPCYSYLSESDGRVTRAAEKVVISRHASAGVYIFRDRQVFISAAAHSLKHADALTYKGNFFVCPMVNGVIADGWQVLAPRLADVQPVGKLFH